jgi:hypothetical protein
MNVAQQLERVLLRLLVMKAASGVDTQTKRKRLESCGRSVKQMRGSVVAISQQQESVSYEIHSSKRL